MTVAFNPFNPLPPPHQPPWPINGKLLLTQYLVCFLQGTERNAKEMQSGFSSYPHSADEESEV